MIRNVQDVWHYLVKMKKNWFEKHGFKSNPLSIKPDSEILIGFIEEIKKLQDDIENKKSIWAIYGGFGSGKTTLVRKLLRKYKNSTYFSHSRVDGSISIKRLIQKRVPFLLRILGKMPKDSVLFLDEAHEMNNKEVNEIMEYYKSGNIKNLILINPNSLIEVKNKINLNKIPKEDAIELVHTRLDGNDLISVQALSMIYDFSKGNPRKILEYAERAIKIADEIGDGRATDKHAILLRESLNDQSDRV